MINLYSRQFWINSSAFENFTFLVLSRALNFKILLFCRHETSRIVLLSHETIFCNEVQKIWLKKNRTFSSRSVKHVVITDKKIYKHTVSLIACKPIFPVLSNDFYFIFKFLFSTNQSLLKLTYSFLLLGF